mmetsp:Transcript_16634/g.46413  ORF Transcript_16634/g.46413 Transcript_16634/m.46413 type:complete len:331 (-) Transcript_16634:144-1136(-)
MVVAALQAMCEWAHRYVESHDAKASRSSAAPVDRLSSDRRTQVVPSQSSQAQHQVFYAVSQALLYVLCYHLDSLMQPKADPKLAIAAQSVVSQMLPRLLSHELDPLSKCLPSVAEEFARQTAALGLLQCSKLAKEAQRKGDGAARESRPLEMFFPFDPYLLLRSRAFLQLPDTYVTWRSGHPSATKEDDDGTDSNASVAGSDEDPEDVAADEDDGADQEDDEEDDDDERRTRFGSMASSGPMGTTPPCFPPPRRLNSALDSWALPVTAAHNAAERRHKHRYPASASDTEGCESPAGMSPMGQSPFGISSASPMSLGCTPTANFFMSRGRH